MTNRYGLCFVRVLLILLLSACAAKEKPEELPLPSPPDLGNVGKAMALTIVNPGDSRIDPDLRLDAFRISVSPLGNQEGEEMVSRAPRDLLVWIGDSFIAALQSVGFRVERSQTLASAPTPLALTITLEDASVHEFEFEGDTEVRILVHVELFERGVLVQRRNYSGASLTIQDHARDHAQILALLGATLGDLLNKALPGLAAAIARASST